MYSNVVLGVDHHVFEEILEDYKDRQGLRARHRPDADDWRDGHRALQGQGRGRDRQAVPAGSARAALGRDRRRVRLLDEPARHHLSPAATTFPTSWGTAVNVQAMVFGNMGETSATGVAFTRNPSTGEKRALRRVPGQRAGRGRGRRHPHAAEHHRGRAHRGRFRQAVAGEADAGGLRANSSRIDAAAREALPRHAGPRVHRRARQAVDAADAQRQAHRQGGAAHRRRDGERRPDHAARRRSRRIDPAALDQLLHPTIDPKAERDVVAHRPARLARRGERRDRVLRRRSRGAEQAGRKVDPGARRDAARRTSTACMPPRAS